MSGHDRPALGTWLKLDTAETVEIAAAAGLDFVIIDLEHALIGAGTVAAMLAVARGCGIDALVRVPDHSGPTAAVVLDQGAAGVVVPNVESVEQAEVVVSTVRLPPLGSRGVSTSARAGGWGARDPHDYMAAQNSSVRLYLQVESPRAVHAAAGIGAVAGVDGLLVGPVDLGAAAGEESVPELLAELERTCAEDGIFLATVAGADGGQARSLVERGYRMLAMSNDATMLRVAATGLRVGLTDGGPDA